MAPIPDDSHLCDQCRMRPTWHWVAPDNPNNFSRYYQCDPCRGWMLAAFVANPLTMAAETLKQFRLAQKGG